MSFQPKFEWINCKTAEETFAEVASKINRPHEDYPHKVPATLNALISLVENKVDSFSSFDARAIHSAIFPGHAWSGRWRNCNVRVGKDNPPSFLQVPDLIEKIFPIARARANGNNYCNHLINWYKEFQMIHPFVDGNGRVAGVIVSVLSWDGDKMLSPLQ